MSTKSKMGRPRVDTELLRFREEREVIDALDLYRLNTDFHADAPSRSEAIRRILRDWLIERGYLKSD